MRLAGTEATPLGNAQQAIPAPYDTGMGASLGGADHLQNTGQAPK